MLNTCIAALALGAACCTHASEQVAAPAEWFAVGTTGIATFSTADDPAASGLTAFDFAVGLPFGNGQVSLLVEAESRPLMGLEPPLLVAAPPGAANLPGANGGEARLTEFRYHFANDLGEWAIGFIESKGYLDASTVANDDKTQFTQAVFVNNPSIDLPGSGLGLSWGRAAPSGRHGYSVVLAENAGSGAFVAAETWWACAAGIARFGAWQSGSGLHEAGHRRAATGGHGLYASIDGRLAGLHWNLRAGLARPGQNDTKSFVGIAAEIPLPRSTLGIAAGRSGLAGPAYAAGAGVATHMEFYYRRALPGGFVVTPSVRFSAQPDHNGGTTSLTAGVRFRKSI